MANEKPQTDLVRRQKAAATTIVSLLVGTILLGVIAFLGKERFHQDPNPSLDIAVRITILIFGLGAVALRRTRFSAMRLQDIGALAGSEGLLNTLQKTTLQLAFLAAAIAAIGFGATLATGNDFYTYGAGVVALAVLLYVYPTQSSWQRTLRLFAPEADGKQAGTVVS